MENEDKPVDRYADAIRYLTAHPEELKKAWERPTSHPGGLLFRCLPGVSMCLTQIRTHPEEARENASSKIRGLIEEIIHDERIPLTPHRAFGGSDLSFGGSDLSAITPATLPVFAEWQRRIQEEMEN